MKNKHQYPYLFYERLQEEKIKSGLNCCQIAQMIGCERKTIYSYLNGSTSPDALKLAKLCVLFNVSADYMLGIEKK